MSTTTKWILLVVIIIAAILVLWWGGVIGSPTPAQTGATETGTVINSVNVPVSSAAKLAAADAALLSAIAQVDSKIQLSQNAMAILQGSVTQPNVVAAGTALRSTIAAMVMLIPTLQARVPSNTGTYGSLQAALVDMATKLGSANTSVNTALTNAKVGSSQSVLVGAQNQLGSAVTSIASARADVITLWNGIKTMEATNG